MLRVELELPAQIHVMIMRAGQVVGGNDVPSEHTCIGELGLKDYDRLTVVGGVPAL